MLEKELSTLAKIQNNKIENLENQILEIKKYLIRNDQQININDNNGMIAMEEKKAYELELKKIEKTPNKISLENKQKIKFLMINELDNHQLDKEIKNKLISEINSQYDVLFEKIQILYSEARKAEIERLKDLLY